MAVLNVFFRAFGHPFKYPVECLTSFFESVAMLHCPKVLEKARNDIDSVVGPDRMPEFEDEEALPYISALIKETLRSCSPCEFPKLPVNARICRWKVIAPTGVPHAITADDEYMGYQIPKGSTVYANIWWVYPRSETTNMN